MKWRWRILAERETAGATAGLVESRDAAQGTVDGGADAEPVTGVEGLGAAGRNTGLRKKEWVPTPRLPLRPSRPCQKVSAGQRAAQAGVAQIWIATITRRWKTLSGAMIHRRTTTRLGTQGLLAQLSPR